MGSFKRAARSALQRAYAAEPGPAARIERMSVDVELEGRREVVSLLLREGELSWSCTCGQARCDHARCALSFVEESDARGGEERITELWDPAPAGTERRVVAHSEPPAPVDHAAMAEVLRDLILALVRSGVSGGLSPSVEDALQRLQRAAPAPMPLGVSRLIGRLKQALGEGDAGEAARVLQTASRVIDDLAAAAPSAEARCRVLSLLDVRLGGAAAGGRSRVSELSLVELARERVPGIERAGIERRYLVDPGDGRLYREERASTAPASLGPCPRQLTVWLAEVEETTPPRRVRLLQYAVSPAIEPAQWEQLARHAERDFEALLSSQRETLRAYGGLAEPVALLAPAGVAQEGEPALIDGAGNLLPVVAPGRPAVSLCFRALIVNAELLLAVGRVIEHGGLLGLLPLALLVRQHGRLRHVQL